jgi:hypothetical protein
MSDHLFKNACHLALLSRFSRYFSAGALTNECNFASLLSPLDIRLWRAPSMADRCRQIQASES